MEPEQLPVSVTRSRAAYERLKEAILTLQLVPGQALVETGLGAQLGMSKTPIRDALGRLEREGLVEQLPFRGAVVTRIAPADIDDIYQVRELLEPFAVRQATARLEAAERQYLETSLTEARRLLETLQFARFYQTNRQFHAFFIRQANNRLLMSIFDNIADRMHRLSVITGFVPNSPERILEQHAAIVAHALDARPEAAAAAMLAHIREFHEALRTLADGQLGALLGSGQALRSTTVLPPP